ncbi:dTDP-4-dehydrorhamnose 3,5-epimerase [Hoyosella rhizosphaerae]|uniref:dTDP-4-dehydrorhamnose 3,5-epimerase n=1 Tax=Hoyosella rhizosphaerae TaxID=1755582 RepID=A0A916UJU6_9ACTN|nr:dTDP-4-dehydrorhamnose 3,5-epimerase [Hoyosella rhizosphaerae]MBN4925462.1 dTDP-4-dehydrorhamnose 3,5-epimerase [Hoyosella rhizosphaerae]GGC74993.1 DTDP-4-dehydrorhamnose 3,5-epimerase RmlC [Hoyosella rhizosphaerae]
MEFRELSIPGAWEITPRLFTDKRGTFLEWFKQDQFEQATGNKLDLAQANCSISAEGTLRGIHFADVPPGQAKYVTCVSGAVLDVIVDIRTGSPTFGQWDSVYLDDMSRRAVFLDVGLGHGFFALSEQATVVYLCSSGYNPDAEHGINPLDPDIGITWPHIGHTGRPLTPVLSQKDQDAPSLAEAQRLGILPTYQA